MVVPTLEQSSLRLDGGGRSMNALLGDASGVLGLDSPRVQGGVNEGLTCSLPSSP